MIAAGPTIKRYPKITIGDKRLSIPPNKRRIIKRVPYCSSCSQNLSALPDKNAKAILDPSKGGTGIRLKKPRSTLIKTNTFISTKTFAKMGLAAIAGKPAIILSANPKIIAIKKLDIGPAAAIKAPSLFGFFKLNGLNGTGLAQPKINGLPVIINRNGTKNDPKNSKCFIGLRVNLPSSLAVLSPNL